MSWAWIGVACGSFVAILFIVMALFKTPGRRVEDDLMAQEFAAMQAASDAKKLDRLRLPLK
jgi:hypothetical protein